MRLTPLFEEMSEYEKLASKLTRLYKGKKLCVATYNAVNKKEYLDIIEVISVRYESFSSLYGSCMAFIVRELIEEPCENYPIAKQWLKELQEVLSLDIPVVFFYR
jgi:hypothetical protein